MRKLFTIHHSLFTIIAFTLFACSGEKVDDNAAALAAKAYYDKLVGGQYVEYVNGMADIDSLPPSYKEQLIVNAKQFVANQKSEHGGIADVRVVSQKTDSVARRTDAFLMLCFADSTKEEVVVPMVERNGQWLMR